MSIAEIGAPTPGEVNVLLIARAMHGRYVIAGSVSEAQALCDARRLVERGFGSLFIDDKAGETFRTNAAGTRWLADHLAKQAAS